MSKFSAIAMFLAMLVGVMFFAEKVGTVEPTPVSPTARTESSIEILNREQDSQAERCKNGYSDGCDKERSLAEFKRATGQ
ncbi:MAG: hypothetical protein H7Z39_04190 [Burkholderiaceae bacterium]|nr:hypothetical protein [Burkholderiaceae bacterium]